MLSGKLLFFAILVGIVSAFAQSTHIYVAALDAESVTLAWGKANGTSENTIGFAARGAGPVTIHIAGRDLTTQKSWMRVGGLQPDTEYPYTVELGHGEKGTGSVRTWPAKADSLVFFVIGDWGNGHVIQYAIAKRMEEERQAREKAGQRVRFVISTGDNIYDGGDQDRDWERKFFIPYAKTLESIPFYAVLGNHDGNESEKQGDLAAYLDNFFFPTGFPSRWYHFSFGGLAEFYMLDSTENQPTGSPAPAFLPNGEQSAWLRSELKKPGVPWRIAVLHHPLFTAGPDHPPALDLLSHWLQMWEDNNVSVVFSGHEHNLQFSERNASTRGIQFVVSGAGGQLRRGNVLKRMPVRNIAAWAPRTHFLVAEIKGSTMYLTPVSISDVEVRDSNGKRVKLPWEAPLRKSK